MDAHKLIAPRWIGMNGALATRSPSGAKRAQEKSRRSFMFVLIEVCWRDLPMASATLMKRLAKRVSMIGSTPFRELLFCGIVIVSSETVVVGDKEREKTVYMEMCMYISCRK